MFGFFKFLSSLKKLSTIHEVCLFIRPSRAKLFSGPLEASRKRPVDGASTERWPSLWLTRFSCILVMGRKKALISLTIFESKNEMPVHTRFAGAPATLSESLELSCACPIFRREKFAETTRYVLKNSTEVPTYRIFILYEIFYCEALVESSAEIAALTIFTK